MLLSKHGCLDLFVWSFVVVLNSVESGLAVASTEDFVILRRKNSFS